MSQTYNINNIISKSGIVQDNNDKYIAYSDQSIDLSYDATNAEQGFGLSDGDIVQIKWFFEKNNQRVRLNDGDYNDKDGQKIGVIEDNEIILNANKFSLNPLTLKDVFTNSVNELGDIKIEVLANVVIDRELNNFSNPAFSSEWNIQVKHPYDSTKDDSTTETFNADKYQSRPFFGRITAVDGDVLTLDRTWNEYIDFYDAIPVKESLAFSAFDSWDIVHKFQDSRDLSTYLHLGDDRVALITNTREDKQTFKIYPYGTLLKLYEPLPEDIDESSNVYVVRELLPQKTEVVDLIPYEQEEEDLLVLRQPDLDNIDSPITNRSTDFKTYSDLITSDSKLQQKIINKYLSGSQKPVELNIDYSNYENFVNFSSAKKRLENFKYKLQQIESFTAESSSFAALNDGATEALAFEQKIQNEINNFDGYESYLYNVSSSYVSSSIGVFNNASVPKTGSGTYADPFVPVSSSNSQFTDWFGSVAGRTGQVHSASLYDIDNPNRLVNLLPQFVREDVENKQFLDFMDMVGQQFDELYVYITAMAKITDRQNDISEGFSPDLIFNLSKALGFDVQDGKDLLDLSRVGFGQKASGSAFELYTSGSIDSPGEADISREITKRIISSMPYLIKTKGTINSLKGLMNCYGIPSSILRVREYGGLQKNNHKAQFEIARKFTKALGFQKSQYVETTWVDGSTGRKPETVELRFKSPTTGSDQVLVQKDTDWAIKLKDNNSADNFGTVSFMLSGSAGYKEVSSSLLPIYDGDFYQVMLRKTKVDTELFPFPSFETGSLVNPPFQPGTNSAERGEIEIVSSSNVAKKGSKSLRHRNTSIDGTSYTYFYRNPGDEFPTFSSAITDVSQHETYVFSAYAKASGSTVDSLGSLTLFELDSNENVVNWDEEFEFSTNEGGIKSSQRVGLNETEWKQIQVKKTMKFPNTAKLGLRFENNKPSSTIFWDDVSLRKVPNNTDTITDAFSYDLFVKKYEAGLDRILLSSKASLVISSSASQSYNANWTGSGNLFIGGNDTTPFSANKLSGSLMEFRLWTEPLEEEFFDVHVSNPKSYIGNTVSSSYTNLARRFSFDDDTSLSEGTGLLDTRPNQNSTQSGSARGFDGSNFFQPIIDKTKTIVPNQGPNRRMATKIRIENNALSGSGAVLERNKRFDQSSNDFAPIDSAKLGVYFSPVDVINEDIVSSFANLDFNKYLGDPRDNFSEKYRELSDISTEYFKKYTGRNSFWDYMHLIKFYDQSIFKQIRKLIPARAKAHLGTLIEGNLFERPKSPVQRNHPSFTQPSFEDTINVGIGEQENETSRSIVIVESEYPNYEATVDTNDRFFTPSLYRFTTNDNYEDRNLYISGSAKRGGPDKVFSEATGAIVLNSRLSTTNQEFKFFYTSSFHYDQSARILTDNYLNLYSSRSLVESDLDPGYQDILALNRTIYEGVKNTKETTIDGDLPVIVRTSAPTVATPVDFGISNLEIDEEN